LTTCAFGQGIVTGSISGTIQDPSSAVIAGAAVKAVQAGTNSEFKTETDGHGYFELRNLPIGSYVVTISSPNFSNLQLNEVIVASGRNNSLGGQTLQVGKSVDLVSVEATAPLIESTTAQIGATFETKEVAMLPNQGTGFDNLMLYVPGVANNGAANFSNSNGASFANNGLRGRSNNFQIDGQSNNDNSVAGPSIFLSNPDVLAEVQAVTNNFSAEYGRNSGSVVNYVTKAGTNSFHGSAYDFNIGNWSFSHLNGEKNPVQGFCPAGVAPGTTTTFATSCNDHVIPRYVENRFGGTFGGPILKEKAWFFGSYQNDRQRSKGSGTSSGITPTPAGLAALAAAFPGNAAVAALQTIGPYSIKAGNPTPAGVVQNLAITNGTTTAQIPFAQITRTVATPFDDKQATGRGDWQISDKDRFFARYVYETSLNAVGSGTISSGAYVAVPAHDQQIGLDYTRTWNNRFVTQWRMSYSRALIQFAGGDAYPNCTIENVTACPTNIAFSDPTNGLNFVTIGEATNLPQDRLVNNTQYQNNSTFTVGRHTIKFGGEYARQRSPNHFLPSINGGFTFSTATGSAGTGNAFSRFIQGTGSTLTLADGTFNFNFKEQDLSFYGQDDWRIRDNLTLNLGMRWEWDQQAINLLHDITVRNVANGFWSSSVPSSVTILPEIPEDLNNFGPNVGFAWTPRVGKKIFGDDKTVIRGGYRIAYDPSFYNIFLNVATAAPVVNLGSISNAGVPAAGIGSAVQSAYFSQIPRGLNPGARNQTRVSDNFHNPYVEQYSLGIQREFHQRFAFDTRYVGNHGVGNFQTINGNPVICSSFNTAGTACTSGLLFQAPSLVPSGVTACSPTAATAGAGSAATGHVNCNFTNLRVRNNGAWSIYNGWQNSLTMRSYHGLTANVSYTFSKAMDNVSEVFTSTGGISTPIAQNPFDPNRAERGVAAQSFPHVATVFWVYELPYRRDQHGILGKLLGGWDWSGTFRYQSGAPITAFQNATNTACDTGYNAGFIASVDSCRPILSNPNAPIDSVGRYVQNTTTGAIFLTNVSTCQSTSNANLGTTICPSINPSDVRFIVNNTLADNALCSGNPFACSVSRNTFRAMPRNQTDLSLFKEFKATERVTVSFRADVFNIFNYAYVGVPGLNANNKNLGGVGTGGAPAPNSFFNTAFNTGGTTSGGRRYLQLEGHVTF
ncbi:MAG TPA: carboxypeptidase regulatory-like domain-containing protein, partial [Terriglobales bacterium]|nr:carboxypeptidase regulatory-like domain-containing protein [Terriglobales bacterium]